MIDGEEQEILLNTLAETPQEEVHTIEEDIYVIGVESLNGQAGDLTLKSINGENLVGEGNIALQTPLNQAQLNAVNSGIDSAKVGQIATNASNITTLQNTKQDNLTQAQLNAVNSGIDATKVAQIATNTGNITSVTNRVTTIEGKIPSAASSSNKLTDKNYVDNAIATNTANYISDNGQPFQSYADLVAYSGPLTNNDYAFVETIDQAGNDIYTRYKYNADQNLWAEEYTITNPYFTSDQWASINSGIAANDVAQIGTNKTDIATLQTSKQDKLTTAQQAAVDSGIDATKVQQIATNTTNIAAKQDKLIAGTNIQIATDGKTISATDTKYTAGTGLTLTGTQFSVTEPVPSGFFTDTTTSQTSEGTDLTINGTTEAPFGDLKIFGDTFQQAYSGKNLADYLGGNYYNQGTLATKGDNSVTFTKSSDGEYRYAVLKLSLAASQNLLGKTVSVSYTKALTISAVNSGYRVFWCANDSISVGSSIYNGLTTTSGEQTATFNIPSTLPDSSKPIVAILFYPDTSHAQSADSAAMTISDLQLEIGSTATAYEPYVGGTASPNPEFPQPVQVVTGEQTVKVTGKNLFSSTIEQGTILSTNGQPSTAGNRVRSADFMPVSENTTYTISATSNVSGVEPTAIMFYYDSNKTYITRSGNFASTPLTVTTPAGTSFCKIAFAFYPGNPNLTPEDISNYQFELGSTATAYEPFQGQTFPISLGSTELAKIGTYQDYIWKDGSDWKIHKEVGKVVLDGSETWLTQTTNVGYMYRLTLSGVASNPTADPANLLSDYFTPTSGARIYSITDGGYIAQLTTAGYIRFNIGDTTDKLSDFKTWLSTHNTTVYYALATPTDTAITDETLIAQLEALWNATSYNPQTNIVSTTSAPNLPAILTIDTFKNNWAGTLAGYQETIKRLEARVEELEA